MSKPVSLQDVVDEMSMLSDEMTAYINRKTGELYTVDEQLARYVEDGDEDNESLPDWQQEFLPHIEEVLESDEWIPLPDQFEIHEYSIMERFCLTIVDDDLREELSNAIRGRGAFRRFKDAIVRRQIREDWFSYRNSAVKRIAADFLNEEGIEFVDDDGT